MLKHSPKVRKPYKIKFAPLNNYQHIGIGVSGGADSLALMLSVAKWSKTQKSPPKITIYCVNHGLRENAIKECALVTFEAKKLGLESQILYWQGEKSKSALQENARKARYKLIAQAMMKDGAQILLTAHHARDQAETILMRMANGSGLTGLIGMAEFSEVQGIKVYRPLLHILPEDLAIIVKQANISAVRDPSNFDENYERVRWRKILPSLVDLGLNEERFEKLSARLKRADSALVKITNNLFEEKVRIDSFGAASISTFDFLEQEEEFALRLLQKILQKIGDSKKPYALSQIETLLSQMSDGKVFKKQTLHGCVIEMTNDKFIFTREISKLPLSSKILSSGEEIVWDNRFIIKNNSQSQNFKISASVNLVRKDFEKLLATKYLKKVTLMQAAPIVKNQNGDIIMLGLFTFSDEISAKII